MAKTKSPPPPAPDPLERYRLLLDEASFAQLLAALTQPLPQAIRLNPLKLAPETAIADLARRYGWQVARVPFCATGWQVLSAQTLPSQTIEFALGQYYIQDAASMLPVELLDFDGLDAPLVLDLAAAPGGKTTHLISRGGDRGLVIGNDSSPGRIAALRGVLRDWGALNCAVTAFPGEKFGPWYPDTFDRVLLDAPCSMENLRPEPGHARRFTSVRERADLAKRQLRLLVSAVQAVRVGGQVVYSTCTLAPEEDEAVLDGLLKLYPGAVEIEDVSGRFERPAGGLSGAFDPAVGRAVRLWPHVYGTSGFFAALITKTGQPDTPRQPPPDRPVEKVGWSRLAARDQRGVSDFLERSFGFDLPRLLERQNLSIWRRGSGLYLFPEAYFPHFAGLPVEGLGMLLAEEGSQGPHITHEWAARFSRAFTRGIVTLAAELVPGWLRGEDAPLVKEARGAVLAVRDVDGRPLGLGRAQSGGLKNLLPRRLVGR